MGIILDFDAAGPVLRRTDADQIARYTVGARAHFALDAQWDGRTITAAWESDGATTATGPMPVTDGTCEIPWEAVRGTWTRVFLTGTLSADDVLTTNSVNVWVLQNSSLSATPPEQPTQTLYDQMVAYAAAIDQQSSTAAQAATSAASSAQASEQAATTAAADLAEFHTELGGKADLVDGLVPAAQLPSFVDDVLEYPTLADFPATGENGKIYVALDANKTYRWGGTAYVFLGGDLAIGETDSTAFRGDHGKTAYDHSQATGNPHGTTPTDIGLVPLAKTVYGDSDYGGTLSADLDTITHNGFYTCYTGTPGLSAEMTALGISWHVLHENSNVGIDGALQTATGFSSASVIEYKRLKVGGTWGAWAKSLASSAVHAIESVTALPASPTATTLYLVG